MLLYTIMNYAFSYYDVKAFMNVGYKKYENAIEYVKEKYVMIRQGRNNLP